MRIEDIEVPEFMLEAATKDLEREPRWLSDRTRERARTMLAAGLLALIGQHSRENYSKEQLKAIEDVYFSLPPNQRHWQYVAVDEWLKMTFLRQTPVLPEEVKKLLVDNQAHVTVSSEYINDRIAKAYALGLAEKGK